MNEEQLEDALQNWPLAEVPTGFSTAVMEKITPLKPSASVLPAVKPKFRLTWMDLALGIFFSSLPMLGLVTLYSLPRKLILYLNYQWLLLQFPAPTPVLLALAGTILMLFLGLMLGLRYILPRQMSFF
jgi:hypothetical protein